MTEVGMEPDTLARCVLKGVEENAIYILPYPEFHGVLEEIHGNATAALAKPEDDPEHGKRTRKGEPSGRKIEDA